MKAKYILVGLLLVTLMISGTGYSVAAGSGDKVTGGGTFTQQVVTPPWLPPNPYGAFGDKMSFGFTAQSDENGAKGQFHLINHDSGMKISGTVSACSATSSVQISGTCSVEGAETSFRAKLTDGGEGAGYDEVKIWFGANTNPAKPDIYGQLAKGNIQKHK